VLTERPQFPVCRSLGWIVDQFGKRDSRIIQLIDSVQADAKSVAMACGDSAVPRAAKESPERPRQAAAEEPAVAT
jgi:hypothetical protein